MDERLQRSKNISTRELIWLLECLSIEQPKVHKNISINEDLSKIC